MKLYKCFCEWCYEEFETNDKDASYCSEACRKKQDKEDLETIERLEEN